jgi:hypothetical protein
MKPRFSMFIGVGLIAIALVGFLSVADELHHSGEFFAVTGILVSGVALYVAGRFSHIAAHLSLAWVPVGIGVGMLTGAMIEEEVIGVCVGLSFGLLLARMFRRRSVHQARLSPNPSLQPTHPVRTT